MNNTFITDLKKELLKPLPGLEIQAKMAPKERLNNFDANPESARKSGVLLLLYYSENEPNIAFIKRAEDGGVHGGQIAFPGGKEEKEDSSIIETALREADEEVGVKRENIEILGTLTNLFIPVSNFNVFTTIGYCNSKPEFIINEDEVDKMIILPLSEFYKKENIKSGIITVRNYKTESPYYNVNNQVIWGATAMIMSEFLEISKKVFL